MAKVVYLKEVRRQSGGWLGGFRTRVAVLLTVGSFSSLSSSPAFDFLPTFRSSEVPLGWRTK